jgi:hypothetical protein
MRAMKTGTNRRDMHQVDRQPASGRPAGMHPAGRRPAFKPSAINFASVRRATSCAGVLRRKSPLFPVHP